MTRINFTIPDDLAIWFRSYCKQNKVNMSQTMAKFIQTFKMRKEAQEAINGENKSKEILHGGPERQAEDIRIENK